MAVLPTCIRHTDCFALGDRGRCICLSDNNFNGKDCPFYKTTDQAYAEQRKGFEDLKSRERYDLIEKYGPPRGVI